jgi:hypothetical protein
MIPLKDYENAIRAKVCAVCIDQSSDGTCALTNDTDLICALQSMLPIVVETIRGNPEADSEHLHQALRDNVCKLCREDERGNCRLRDEINCALDRYFPLVIETVEEIRERNNSGKGAGSSQVNYEIPSRAIEEHHELDKAQRVLRKATEKCLANPSESAYTLLLQSLRVFRSILFAHLSFEEEDGFMKPVLEVRPTLSPVIERLRAEHDHLRSDIDAFILGLDKPGPVGPAREDIPKLVIETLSVLKAHENMENGVILEAFVRDIGVND